MRKRKNVGQTMTEYIIIVALCAIGLLLVVTFFGNDIRQIFYTASTSLREGAATDVDYDEDFTKGGGKHQVGGGNGLSGDE